MPARSKSQQRLFGMVHAYQKGKFKDAPEEVKNIARSISSEDAEHFAKTKHKGLPEKKAYMYGFMDKLAEMSKLAETRVEKQAAFGIPLKNLSALTRLLRNRRSAGPSMFGTTSGRFNIPTPRFRETYDEMRSLLGPKMTAGEFMEVNPYNDFTVFKGDVRSPFVTLNAPTNSSDLWFMSARPTVALDYHIRPLSGNTSRTRMLATGDLRRSPTFLEGDRFLSPQSASVDLDDQIRAAVRGRGTQQYYRTGYHRSSDFPDFEIPLPRQELGYIFDKYYLPTQIRDVGFTPFGRFAETYTTAESFNNLPFVFQQVRDPKRFSELAERLRLAGKPPLDSVANGLRPVPPRVVYPNQLGAGNSGRKITITDVPLPLPSGIRQSVNTFKSQFIQALSSQNKMSAQPLIIPQPPPKTVSIAGSAVPFRTAQGLAVQRFLSRNLHGHSFSVGGQSFPLNRLPRVLSAISLGVFHNPPPGVNKIAWTKAIIADADQLAKRYGLIWNPPKVV